nr:PREDICTED: ribosome-binding protein 1-like [Lepisosteus oculatus]
MAISHVTLQLTTSSPLKPTSVSLNQTIQNQAFQTQSVQNQAQAVHTRAVQSQAFQNQSVQRQALQTQSVQTQSVQNQALQTQSIQTQSVQSQTFQNQPVQTQSIQNQAGAGGGAEREGDRRAETETGDRGGEEREPGQADRTGFSWACSRSRALAVGPHSVAAREAPSLGSGVGRREAGKRARRSGSRHRLGYSHPPGAASAAGETGGGESVNPGIPAGSELCVWTVGGLGPVRPWRGLLDWDLRFGIAEGLTALTPSPPGEETEDRESEKRGVDRAREEWTGDKGPERSGSGQRTRGQRGVAVDRGQGARERSGQSQGAVDRGQGARERSGQSQRAVDRGQGARERSGQSQGAVDRGQGAGERSGQSQGAVDRGQGARERTEAGRGRWRRQREAEREAGGRGLALAGWGGLGGDSMNPDLSSSVGPPPHPESARD